MTHTERTPEGGTSRRSATAMAAVGAALILAPFALLFSPRHRSPAPATQIRASVQQSSDVAQLEAAVHTNPTSANRLNLSLAYINAGRPGQAQTVLRDLLFGEPKNAAAWNNLCVAQINLHELSDAEGACESALELRPDFQLARNNLNWVRTERNAETNAIAKLKVTAASSRDRDLYLALGLREMHLGEYDDAIRSWNSMLAINSHDAMAANNIGTALMLKHQPLEAEVWFRKAIDWDSSMQIARNNLAWAKGEGKSTVSIRAGPLK